MRRLSALSVLLVATVLVACATLPPAKPVQDLRTIAGTWQGTVTSSSGTSPYTLTIKEDGSWEGLAPDIPPGRFEGKMSVKEGKIRLISHTTGRTGTYTLHEGEGKRALTGATDEKDVTVQLRPAK